LDWHVRLRLAELPSVQIMEEADVVGLLPNASGNGVMGAAIRLRGSTSASASEIVLCADLVVDASGRASRAPLWLEALGFPAPEQSVIGAGLGYASCIVRLPAGHSRDNKGVFLQAAPPVRVRGGIAMPIEWDRWLITL